MSASVGASIGIALAPQDATEGTGLMWCADTAMYRAKLGDVSHVFYDQDVDGGEQQLNLVEELRDAVEGGHFVLHYQPQLDLRSGVTCMILGRLRGHQDKGSLAGALVKGGLVVVKAGKLLLALASFAAYAFLFTWQFAVIIVGMLVIHECGHLRCMKHYGMKTRGIYLIPLLGAAAVAEDNFPSRRAEATIALAGPLTGAVLAAGTGLVYFATRNGAFAAAAAWMALINLFNLLPVVPLDGGRVVKSITCSVGSRTGLAALIAGMLLGAVLAVTADLWIFVILIPLGLLDYLYDRHQVTKRGHRAGGSAS